ncbi:50S ribosomal protein L19, partial [Shewanella sp. A3A]|nr:50S ribosomal protein L19 [Shewanella ferrihydritica]
IVIKVKRNGYNTSFTVRKVSYGVGVERIFPLNSPVSETVEIVQRGRARRATLDFIRELSDREIRRKLRADRKRIGQD